MIFCAFSFFLYSSIFTKKLEDFVTLVPFFQVQEKFEKVDVEYRDLVKKHEQILEDKNVLAEQLQAETELCQEAEEARNRLLAKKEELEDIITEFEAKLTEEEDKVIRFLDEKKKLQAGIQDLEETYVFVPILFKDSKMYQMSQKKCTRLAGYGVNSMSPIFKAKTLIYQSKVKGSLSRI